MFLMLLSLSIYKGMDMVPLCFKLFQEMLGCFPKQLHHFISHPQCTECSLSLAPRGLRGCWGRGNHLGTRRSLGAFGCWEQVPAQLDGRGIPTLSPHTPPSTPTPNSSQAFSIHFDTYLHRRQPEPTRNPRQKVRVEPRGDSQGTV